MLEFFGGTPTNIVCDNLRSGVIKANFKAPLINETRGLLADSFAARWARLESDEMLTMVPAAQLIGTIRATIDKWISKGRAIGLSHANGGFSFQRGQFEKRVWDLLPALSRSLHATEGWALLAFLETPQGAFERASPSLMIERGHRSTSRGHPVSYHSLRSVVSRRISRRAVRAYWRQNLSMTDALDDALAVIRAAALLSCDLKKAASWYFVSVAPRPS